MFTESLYRKGKKHLQTACGQAPWVRKTRISSSLRTWLRRVECDYDKSLPIILSYPLDAFLLRRFTPLIPPLKRAYSIFLIEMQFANPKFVVYMM